MNRMEVRKKIQADAKDLCTLVVNTCCEYKEELMRLEWDNMNLVKENTHLENVNRNLTEQNELLLEELESAQKRILKLIEKLGQENLCQNCDHFLDCNLASLCAYCQKWVCVCCSRDCNDQDCRILLCNSCFSTHPLCPAHDDRILDPTKSLLIQYYKENKFKNIVL